MKKISIIVPCYNAESYIERCIQSLVNQTIGVENLEIILVDDASTDGTLDRLLEYEKAYPESIMVIACEENGRQGTARNIGLSYASGEFIAFVDSDDWCELDMYERMYHNAMEQHCDVVMCGYVRDDGTAVARRCPKRNRVMEVRTADEIAENMVYQSMGTGIWILICKREFLLEHQIYFAENLCYEDCLWISLFYAYVRRAYVMDEELYHYYINPESTVLKANDMRHLELFDVAILLWEEYRARGIIKEYPKVCEFDFIRLFYMQGMKMLSLRFDDPPFEVYQYMAETVKQMLPDWKDNPYIVGCLEPFYVRMLKMTEYNMQEPEFHEFMKMVKASFE